jgi:DNA helicase-2/ATP-dependent DNA helicase PcrA
VLFAFGYQSKDEALIRVINYPARGIGDTAGFSLPQNHYKRSIFVMEHIDKIDLKLNSGTRAKLQILLR